MYQSGKYPSPGGSLGGTAWSVALNVFTFVIALAGLVVLFILHPAAVNNGFFCDDNTIRYPVKEETITVPLLFLLTLGPALVTILISEAIRHFCSNDENTGENTDDDKEKTWRLSLLRVALQLLVLIFGFTMNTLLTEVIKISTGRLRPHFIELCQLKPGSYNCSEGMGYVTEYTCTQTDLKKLSDARKSFVSGHASISFYFMSFIIMYIGFSVRGRYPFLVWFFQVASATLACYICISRVTDNKHHPTDVILGGIVGIIFGVYTVHRLSTILPFRKKQTSSDEIELCQVKTA